MTAFLRAAEAEESKTPVQSPAFLEKLICGASARGSSTTKTMKIESKRGISSGDKTSRTQPTVDDSLKTTKPSTKESTKPVTKESSTRNQSVQGKPTKNPKSSGEKLGEGGSQRKEPTTTPSKTRPLEHEHAVDKPTKNKPL